VCVCVCVHIYIYSVYIYVYISIYVYICKYIKLLSAWGVGAWVGGAGGRMGKWGGKLVGGWMGKYPYFIEYRK